MTFKEKNGLQFNIVPRISKFNIYNYEIWKLDENSVNFEYKNVEFIFIYSNFI